MTNMSNVPRITFLLDSENDKQKQTSGLRQKKQSQCGIGQWISYMNSAEYKQIRPADVPILESDLAEHNKPDDLWMALNQGGKRAVFDVTPFARFHPGGLDILMEHAGTDASEAFRMAHAYVNVDMIGNLRKGFLKRDKPGTGRGRNHLLPSMVVPRLSNPEPTRPKWDWVANTSSPDTVELVIRFPRFRTVTHTFSWMDRLRTVAFWQPGSGQTNGPGRGRLLIRTLLDETYHKIEFSLLPTLVPRLSTLRSSSGGLASSSRSAEAHVVVELEKQADESVPTSAKPISTIGTVLTDSLVPAAEEADINLTQMFINCTVVESRQLPETPYRFIRISWSPQIAWLPVPLGHHVYLRVSDSSGQPVCRPYTPVLDRLDFKATDLQSNSTVCTELSFLIKIYPDGVMSQLLSKLKPGDPIESSLPAGQVPHDFLRPAVGSPVTFKTDNASCEQVSRVFMLAAGSGITPMLRLLLPFLLPATNCLEKSESSCVPNGPSVHLVCFDRTEADQVLVTELSQLQSRFPDRFRVSRVLSDPRGDPPMDDGAPWIKGRVSESLCRKCLFADVSTNQTESETAVNSLWLICGPPGFDEAASSVPRQWHVPESHIVVFRG